MEELPLFFFLLLVREAAVGYQSIDVYLSMD
jgi:hypothetical protein